MFIGLKSPYLFLVVPLLPLDRVVVLCVLVSQLVS